MIFAITNGPKTALEAVALYRPVPRVHAGSQ
ncbi:hypothetical protein JOE60_000301 [Paenarthrobacter ilicis]|uniref:Uncharacterized protein n=1 Tax=Paenarthrobacter ilicis TaxID=43665 RepID=A0ABX0TGL7_9MICC|nr:hypothetical protein [Paenarthrobacter ilicis]NIJ01665.1 hypothetical protein [Paenarthrobacter ilicis]